jgi:ATP-dependent RNA helicase DeaD
MITFEQTGIRPELVKAVSELGYQSPMPVQEQVIPVILNSKQDIVALAQTGTGKTAAFGLPLLSVTDDSSNRTQVIILSPTRELCLQITKDLTNYAKFLPQIRIVAVYGGASIEDQIRDIRKGAQIIVATPGRINDLIRRGKVQLSSIHSVVLDEADEMLNMGFKEDLNTILDEIPKDRRTLLFSATMSREVAAIARNYMNESLEITVGNKNAGAENVKHHYYMVHASDRYLALKRIVDFYPDIYGIIFCRTRQETKDVAEKLMKDGYSADALHGDLSQQQRDYAMQRFRLKNLQMLVATDVAARGLDVEDLTHVINYNLPDDVEIYTHRSGRTGRAGKSGISVSITHMKEKGRIALIEKIIKKKFDHKMVPLGKEICEKQLINLVDKMEKVEVNDAQIEEFLPVIYKKLEWLSREELIKKFVSTEFNRFLDYYKNAVDINVKDFRDRDKFESRDRDRDRGRDRDRDRRGDRDRDRRGDRDNRVERSVRSDRDSRGEKEFYQKSSKKYTLFRINMGTRDGLTPGQLIGIINGQTRNRDISIGKANILKNDSMFEADSNYATELMDAFRDCQIEGRKISVKVAGFEKTGGKRY